MTDSDEKQRGLDATMENEGSRDLSPMVQISVKEYDKLKEQDKYITDPVSYTHLTLPTILLV